MIAEIERQIAALSVRIAELTRDGFEAEKVNDLPAFRKLVGLAAPLIARRQALRQKKERINNQKANVSTKIAEDFET